MNLTWPVQFGPLEARHNLHPREREAGMPRQRCTVEQFFAAQPAAPIVVQFDYPQASLADWKEVLAACAEKNVHGIRLADPEALRKKRGVPLLEALVDNLPHLRWLDLQCRSCIQLEPLGELGALVDLRVESRLEAQLLGRAPSSLRALRLSAYIRPSGGTPQPLGNSDLAWFEPAAELETLALVIASKLSTDGLEPLPAMAKLTALTIESAPALGGPALDALGAMGSLRDLELTDSLGKEWKPPAAGFARHLDSLCLRRDPTGRPGGFRDRELVSLEGFGGKHLNLSNHRLGDGCGEVLGNLTGLEELTLSGNKSLTDEGLAALAKPPNLRKVNLIGTQVTPHGALRAFSRHPRRGELRLALSFRWQERVAGGLQPASADRAVTLEQLEGWLGSIARHGAE
jgi:hypothetical protein